MDNNSETESEVSASSLNGVHGVETSHSTLSALPPQDTSLDIPLINLEDVMQEIRKLSDQDMNWDFENAVLLDELQCSADTLISFVTHIPELLAESEIRNIIVAVAALIDVTFLDRLFLYRKILRDAAITMPSVHKAAVILTWVDELLARLHSVLLTLASGAYLPDHEISEIAESIQSKKRDDVLRATIQLPEKWADVHPVIGSANFSQAAKRIATSLLFGAYVVQPGLMHIDAEHWPNTGPERSSIMSSLYLATSHLSLQMQSPSTAVDPHPQRVMAAMLIVLFSALDYSITGPSTDFSSPKLRPEGFRHLLYLLQLVMAQPTDSFMPVEHLDIPQSILLRWGNVVPWSWSTWDDQRIANTEHLPCLTSTWLYHLNDPRFTSSEDLFNSNDKYRSNFRPALFADVKAASLMILQLLQNTVQALSQQGTDRDIRYPVFLILLSKLCWAIVQYLESNTVRPDYAIEARIPEYAKFMVITFTLLGTSFRDLFVKNLIVESLTLVPSKLITSSIRILLKDQTHQLLNRLGEATRTCIKTLTSLDASAELEQPILNAKVLIEFLTIALSTTKRKEKAIQEIAAPFVEALVKILNAQDDNSMLAANLRTSILIILCSVTRDARSERFDEDAWALAIHSGSRDLITAGIFAHYLLQPGRSYGILLCYEAWNYLLSAMITILSRELLEEEEPLALVASTPLCSGLKNLVHGSSASNRQMILSSPWTSIMETLLKKLLNNTSATEPYFIALKRRLARSGESLLAEVSNIIPKRMKDIHGSSSSTELNASEVAVGHYDRRLVYYRGDSYTGLLYVCGANT